jgi:hypothetical protein
MNGLNRRVTGELEACRNNLRQMEYVYARNYGQLENECKKLKKAGHFNYVLEHQCKEASALYEHAKKAKRGAKKGVKECVYAQMIINQAIVALENGQPESLGVPRFQGWKDDVCREKHKTNQKSCERDELCYFRQEHGEKGMCREKFTSKGNPFRAFDLDDS